MITQAILLALSAFPQPVSAEVGASTPQQAVLEAATRADPSAAIELPWNAFDKLPAPGPGVWFVATARPSADRPTFSVNVEAKSGRRVVRRQYAFQKRARADVVVVLRPFAPGETFGADDVELRTSLVPGSASDYASSLSEVVGRIATRPLGAGEPVPTSFAKAVTVIHRRDAVRVRVQSGGLTVETTGEALGDGAPGDSIRVQSASRKILEARVVESGLVEVFVQ